MIFPSTREKEALEKPRPAQFTPYQQALIALPARWLRTAYRIEWVEVRNWLLNRDPAEAYSVETLGIMTSFAASATDQADTVTGGEQGELLYGFNGNDTILGMGGDDVLVGGRGNDLLHGGAGNDPYRFSRGFGKDRIDNLDTAAGRCDLIEFTGDIRPDKLVFTRAGNDLLINLGISGDQLRNNSHSYRDSAGGYAVDTIRFADGTTIDIGGFDFTLRNTLVTRTTETGDELHGTLGDDVIEGLGGNDTIFGKEGADTLKGSAGSHWAKGQALQYHFLEKLYFKIWPNFTLENQ